MVKYNRSIGFKLVIIGCIAGSMLAILLLYNTKPALALILAGVVCVVPFTIRMVHKDRLSSAIDKNLAHFILHLRESTKNGLNIMAALQTASDIKPDALSNAVKRLLLNIVTGSNMDDAFGRFSSDLVTPIGRSVAHVIKILVINGGNIPIILERTYNNVYTMHMLEEERKAKLSSYKHIVYISYIIYVVIAVMLSTNLFASVEGMTRMFADTSNNNGSSNSLFKLNTANIGEMREIMLHMGLIEAIFGGLGIGKICDGSMLAGLRHTVFMAVICIVVFYIGGMI